MPPLAGQPVARRRQQNIPFLTICRRASSTSCRAAQTTRIAKVRDGLLKIADRFDTLADQREREQFGGGPVGDE